MLQNGVIGPKRRFSVTPLYAVLESVSALQNPKIEPGVLWEDGLGVTLTSFHPKVN